MMPRLLISIACAVLCASPVALRAEQTWNPATAVADADRDIALHKIRFCYVGGIVSHAPGLPPKGYAVAADYPQIAVGPQSCIQHHRQFETNTEYASRYNARMWHFSMSRPDLWK